mmetsp:Transcript_133447/g.297713  ORF Transcript_133447/g.297713 Transcript_133447/m.297713 type:complete len:206 (-) Transcript_133447:133-750(-)
MTSLSLTKSLMLSTRRIPGFVKMMNEGSKPAMTEIHSLASHAVSVGLTRNSRNSASSSSKFKLSSIRKRNLKNGSSPGTTLRNNGPGVPKPGPSTSTQPAFSVTESNSTHCPPIGPFHVRPVVKSVEPTGRVNFTTVALGSPASADNFFTKVRWKTRYSTASCGRCISKPSTSLRRATSAASAASRAAIFSATSLRWSCRAASRA